MRVRVRVSQGPVAESNCVTARWGGEQLEANWRSAGDELDSAGCDDEPAIARRSPKSVRYAESARVKRYRNAPRGWRRNVGNVWRDKRGDLQPEVTGGRSQNHRSTDGLQEQSKAKRSGNRCSKRGTPLVPKLCRRRPEKRRVGTLREERVVGKWRRKVQKERQA